MRISDWQTGALPICGAARDFSGRAIGKGDADHLGHRKRGLSGGLKLRPFASMRQERQGVVSQSPLAMIHYIIIWAGDPLSESPCRMCLPSSRALLFRSEEHTSELQSLMRLSYA